MLQDYVNTTVRKLLQQKHFLIILTMVLAFSNVLLAFGLLGKSEKVILVPPEINRSFWVTNSKVSDEYLQEMAVFLVDLILDQTPESARIKREMLMKYVSSSYHNALFEQLIKQEEYITQNDVSTEFVLKEAVPVNGAIEITGEIITYVATKQLSRELVKYLVEFEYKGKLLLSKFEKI